jgi:hypothetical protein
MTIGKRYIEVEVDGELRAFHKLTPYDRADIAEKMRGQMREKLEANISSLTDEQKAVERDRFDTEFPFRPIMRMHIATDAGQVDVLLRALQKDNSPEKSREILQKFTLDEEETFRLTEGLCGLKPLPQTPNEHADDNSTYGDPPGAEPNPQKPEEDSYQTPPATK